MHTARLITLILLTLLSLTPSHSQGYYGIQQWRSRINRTSAPAQLRASKQLPTHQQRKISKSPYLDTIEVAKVIKVKDGDTFDFLDTKMHKLTVRLAGIDAPEKAQPFSKVSTKRLTQLLSMGKVVVYQTGRHYNRIVAEVRVDGIDVNLTLVKEGLAWREPRFDKAGKYIDAERRAREDKLGLWIDPTSKEPWIFRQEQKNKDKQSQPAH